MTATTEHIPLNMRLSMLQAAVSPVEELRQIQTTADTLATATGTPITFDHYVALLESAAAVYDTSRNGNAKGNRSNNQHDFSDPSDYELGIEYDTNLEEGQRHSGIDNCSAFRSIH